MIILDTHIWIWHVQDDPKLSDSYCKIIERFESLGLGISSISFWEIAKAVEHGRLSLPESLDSWFGKAIAYPGIKVIELSPQIAIESTQLPGDFHRDPADQIIVATARTIGCPLLTVDSRILKYDHVKSLQ